MAGPPTSSISRPTVSSFPSSLSTSTSSSSTASSNAMPSGASPMTGSTYGVPFSWESRPGIPKPSILITSSATPAASTAEDPHRILLPLPPPPLPHSESVHISFPASSGHHDDDDDGSGHVDGPFAIALAECAGGLPTAAAAADGEELGLKENTSRRQAPAPAVDFACHLGLHSLRWFCKATCSVEEATVPIPRVGSARTRLDPETDQTEPGQVNK